MEGRSEGLTIKRKDADPGLLEIEVAGKRPAGLNQ
jgi:hypothetical protein